MKRFCTIIISILILLSLTGCGNDTVTVVERGSYFVTVNGEELTVDPINQTITAENGDVYTYTMTDESVTFTYPNGYEYFWNFTSGIGYGGLSDTPDGYRYLDYMELEAALDQEIEAVRPSKKSRPGHIFFACFCFLIGGLNLAFPYAGWYLKYGWRYKDAEPSDAALVLNRVLGGIIVIAGIIFLLV